VRSPRVAIIAHVFYERLWPELEKCIGNFILECGSENVDVFITYPEIKPQIAELLSGTSWRKFSVPNVGWDVGPFFHVLEMINLDAYDYVVKLHTKDNPTDGWMNFRPWKKGEHRKALLSICSTRKAVRKSLRAFERDASIGMVAARSVIDPSGIAAGDNMLSRSGGLLETYGISMHGTSIVYGTMFMVRSRLLKAFQGKVVLGDFEVANNEPGKPHSVGYAGTWEMTFAVMVESQGFRVARGVFPHFLSVSAYRIEAMLFRCLRLLSKVVAKIKNGV